MSHIIRTTNASVIIESDGISPAYGPRCGVQGAWVGKVSIPKSELTEIKDEYSGLPAYEWSPDAVSIERASAGEIFAIVASADWRAPKGSKRFGCRKIA